jgi:enamine deaminase RidA (YjgF/YER057c/UK114 family)
MSIDRIQPGEWNARAVVHNGTAYLSGIVADDKTLPMKEQTEQVLAKIDGVLASIGTDKTKILSSVVYLADMDKKDDMNEAWMALDR